MSKTTEAITTPEPTLDKEKLNEYYISVLSKSYDTKDLEELKRIETRKKIKIRMLKHYGVHYFNIETGKQKLLGQRRVREFIKK